MPKILVIDDRADNLLSVKAILKSYEPDYEFVSAQSGHEGIELALSEKPDTILLDVHLPEMDGYAVCRELRSNKTTQQIPIIFLTTTKTSSEDRIKGLELGADAYLSKPIDPADLISILRVMLRIKKAEDTNLRQYQSIVSSSSDMIALLDMHYTYLVVNEQYAKAFKMTSGQMVGLTSAEVFGEEMFKTLIQPHVSKCLKGESVKFETTFDFPELGRQDMEINYYPYYDDDKLIAGFMVNGRNITNRKQTESALHADEKRIESIFRAAPTGIGVVCERILEQVNTRMCEMVGYTEEELVGQSSRILYSNDEDFEYVGRAKYEQIRDHGTGTVETCFKHKAGHLINVLLSSTPIDPDDLTVGVTFTALDITERKKAQEQLQENEALYRSVVGALSEGLIVQDQSDKIIFANQAASKLLGLSMDQLKGKDSYDPRWQALHQDGKPFQPEEHPSMISMRTGAPVNNTIMNIQTGDGERRVISINSRPIFNDSNEVVQVAITFSDMTERKRAEESLKESEEKFRTLFTTMEQGVVYQDSKGNITHANKAAEAILGLSLDQMLGRTSMHPEWKAVDEDMVEIPGDKHPAMLALKTGKTIRNIIQGVYNPTRKEYVWILVNATPQFAKGRKTPYQAYSTFSDITERKTAEKELARSERDFRGLFNNAHDAIILFEEKAEIVLDANQRAFELYGYSAEQFIGMSLAKISTDPEMGKKRVKKVLKNGFINQFEVTQKHKDGSLLQVEVNASTTEYRGSKVILSLNHDISERKQAEEKLRINKIRFRELVNTINSGVAVYKVINEGKRGADYIIQDFNKSALAMENLTLDEVVGKSLGELRPNIDEYGLIPIFQKVWKTGEHVSFPAKQYVDNKYSSYYENQVYKLPNGEIVAIYDDVTDKKNAVDEIAESQKRFDLALDATKDGVYDWNLVTNEIYYSPNWKKMLGYEDDELPNDFSIWEELTEPEDRKASWIMQEELIQKKRDRFELEFKMKHKDGHWVDVLSRAEAVFDENNEKAIRMVGTHKDITKQKQAEEELKESEEKFRALMQQSPFVVELYDLKGLQISVNKAYEDLWAFPADTTVNKFNLLKSKEVADSGLLEYVKRAYAGESVDVPEYEFDPTGETEAQGPGRTRWLNTRIYPLKDKSDQVYNIVIVHQDITDRKQAEAALSDSEEKYRLIVENANDGIEISQDDKIIYSNTRFAEMLGYSVDEITNLSFGRLFSSQAKQDLKERTSKRQSTGIKSDQYETTLQQKGGSPIDVDVKYEIIDFQGKPATFAIIRDITASKQAEQDRLTMEAQLRQSQKLEAVGTMAGGIAHDFNNILQGLFLYSEIISDQIKNSDKELRADFDQIIKSSKRAKELVKQILTFSRREDINLKASKIQYLLKNVLKLIRASTPTTVEINEKIDTNCGPVLCDSTQVHQVIVNLCNNAVQAMRDKGGTLSISLQEVAGRIEREPGSVCESESGCVELIVADTGHGIDATTLEQIFDPFFTTKGVGEGTGLGLSIVHGIIKNMNGQITVESKPGQGTTFRILIPISEEKMIANDVVASETEGAPLSVLFVDDDAQISNAAKLILEKVGHRVTLARNGHEALELFQQEMNAYDLIITDLTMPRMTGLELGEAIHKLSKNVHIILTSGNLDPDLQTEYESLGFNGFVRKPWTAPEMLKVISSLTSI